MTGVMPAATAGRLVKRGLMYWLLIRLAMMLSGAVGFATLAIPGMIMAAAVAGFLAHTDYVFFRERIIAGNLGIWGGWFALLPALVSLSIDVSLWLLLPALRIAGDVLL